MFVVFDLDGTLADIEHRAHLIRGTTEPDWPGFYRACVHDKPITPAIQVLLALARDGHRVEVWSGRSNEVLGETLTWLDDQRVRVPYTLRMRQEGDHRADHLVKAEWITKHGRPDLVFEDRDQVVQMWRAAGVPCFQVAPGGF